MTANTKLNPEQKRLRKSMMALLVENGGFIYQTGRVTVAKLPEFPDSKMAKFSVSICSESETKFRRKVGEFHALRKMFQDGEYVKLPNHTMDASEFTDFVGYSL